MKVALERNGFDVEMVWHDDGVLPACDLVAVPGGFSYGDYLRCGAISANSKIMAEIKAHAEKGKYVLGVCNGFQVLTEAGLLDGVLMRNRDLKFICKDVNLKVANDRTDFTKNFTSSQIIKVPVAHHDGNYQISEDGLKGLEDNDQIAFLYADARGNVEDAQNINGSVKNIAGVFNKNKNVLGLMPHPERVYDSTIGNAGKDGNILFESLLG